MADEESNVLAGELGKLGGLGAKWMAKLLRTSYHESALEMQGSAADVARRLKDLVLALGQEIPQLPSDPDAGKYAFLTRGGMAGLNPAIVYLRVEASGPRAKIVIRAAAKEGVVKQRTAQGVVERVENILAGRER
jgi:hypothetical protein